MYKDKSGKQLEEGGKIKVVGKIDTLYTHEYDDRNLMVKISDDKGEYTIMLRPESVERCE